MAGRDAEKSMNSEFTSRAPPGTCAKSTVQIRARLTCGQRIIPSGARALKLSLRRILRGRQDPAGDLPHMFSGIGKLTFQKFRLNSHRLLKVGRVNQFPRMLERSLYVLFGKRQSLFRHLRSRARNRGYRLVCSIEKHSERFFRLFDRLLRQIAQFGRDFQFRFHHVTILRYELKLPHFLRCVFAVFASADVNPHRLLYFEGDIPTFRTKARRM
jgi:hypothetical protein